MIRPCDPARRRCPELSNFYDRHLTSPCNESLEDYWEDSSVSIRPCRSWETASSPWLRASGLHPVLDSVNDENEVSHDVVSRRSRYSFDASDHFNGAKGRRCFPPPLASCSTLSIKEGGRFVLKEMDTDRPQGYLRAQRENGRLLLQLILPEESCEDVAASENEDDESNDDGGVIDEDNASIIEGLEGSVANIPDQTFNLQYAAQKFDEIARRDQLDCAFGEEVVASRSCGDCLAEGPQECERASGLLSCEGGVLNHSPSFRNGRQDETSERARIIASPERQDFCNEGETYTAERHYIAANGRRLGVQKGDVVGLRGEEIVVDGDAAKHSMPSLGSWSPKQMCLHPPLTKMPTVYSLAIS